MVRIEYKECYECGTKDEYMIPVINQMKRPWLDDKVGDLYEQVYFCFKCVIRGGLD